MLNEKDLQNLQMILTDIISGDTDLLSRPEFRYFNTETIQTALNFLLSNETISDKDKAYLVSNSWRINYRAKPPSPEEFITEKYIGRSAVHTYDRVKDTFVNFLDPTKPYRDLILYPFIGFGKMVSPSTIIHTPEGIKQIKCIKVGDEVCTPEGGVAKVLATKLWKDEEFATITFSDGRTIHSGLDHYFKAAKSHNNKKWDKTNKEYIKIESKPCWKVISLREILKDIKKNPKARWFIPLTKPVEYTEKPHVIHPYSLGALLGDGHLGQNVISLFGNDKQIFDEVEKNLPEDLLIRYSEHKNKSCEYVGIIRNKEPWHPSDYMKEIERLGLRNSHSAMKFIPDEYLFDSVENRISLLQGLMDTDGTVAKKLNNRSHASYYTVSEELRDDFITLVRGLGGQARYFLDSKENRKSSNFDGYIIYFTFPNDDFPIFKLNRKQEIVNNDFNSSRVKRKPQYLYIKNIEKTENTDGICIELDDEDRLFLADDYIVTHNSYLTTLVTLFIGTHLSLMRNPYKFFGLNPASILTQLLISYSLKKSSELLLEPMVAILESSPFFEKVHTREGMIKKDRDFDRQENVDRIFWTTAVPSSAIQMSNGANVKLASSVHSLLGLTVVSGAMSELAFFRDAGKDDDYIMRIFNDLKGRVESRMRGNYFGRTILDSSPNTLDSPIDDYVVNQAHKNPKNFVVQGSRWQWALPGEFDMSKLFHVHKGGKGQPPYIIEEDSELERVRNNAPEKVVEVPLQLKQLFIDDIYKALKDQAGIPSGSSDNLIYDYTKIERIFRYPFKNVYTHISASIKREPEGLIWNQIHPQFFRKTADRYEFYYKPWLPRVAAVDQSLTNDVSAIVIMHVEKMRGTDNLIYVTDMIIPIAPLGDRISLDAIKFFLEDLRNKGNMTLTHLSFDQFQSEASIQYLNKKGFKVEKLSVDSSTDPYIYMLGLIETGRLVSGKNLHFKNNLKSIKFVKTKRSGKTKVDHDSSRSVIVEGSTKWSSSLIGSYAKDASDAAAACCELLRIHHPYSSEMWDPDYITRLGSPEGLQKEAKDNIFKYIHELDLTPVGGTILPPTED